MPEKEKRPEVFRIILPQSLKDGLGAVTQIRIALSSWEEYQTALILEGPHFYNAGIRRVYDALCLLTQNSGDKIDRAEIDNFRKAIEDYLIPRER